MQSKKNYLQYISAKKYAEGLLDRRSCLMILLAEAKLSRRVAVIPKFRLGAHHNHGQVIESYLIDDYLNIDRLGVEYIFEEAFESIKIKLQPEAIFETNHKKYDFKKINNTLVIRNLKDDNLWGLKLYDVFFLAKLYHGVGVKYVIPEVEPTAKIKEIGDQILASLERPILGLHLRRGDRLNRKLNESMNEDRILQKLNALNFRSAYIATNDPNYRINDDRFFSSSNYPELLGQIRDNYLLFAIEMYIVDHSDISVRTFNDSSPFFHIEDQSPKNYALCNYSMHGSNNSFKNIPKDLVVCHYEDKSKNNRKAFVKSRPIIPRIIMALKRKLKRV